MLLANAERPGELIERQGLSGAFNRVIPLLTVWCLQIDANHAKGRGCLSPSNYPDQCRIVIFICGIRVESSFIKTLYEIFLSDRSISDRFPYLCFNLFSSRILFLSITDPFFNRMITGKIRGVKILKPQQSWYSSSSLIERKKVWNDWNYFGKSPRKSFLPPSWTWSGIQNLGSRCQKVLLTLSTAPLGPRGSTVRRAVHTRADTKLHRTQDLHGRSHWVTFSPECIYNGYYIEPAEKRPRLQREIKSYRSSVSMNSFFRPFRTCARSYFTFPPPSFVFLRPFPSIHLFYLLILSIPG